MTALTIVYAHKSTDAIEAILQIGQEAESTAVDSKFKIYGEISTPEKAARQAKRSGRPSFNIEFGTYEFGLCPIANHEIDVLRITMDSSRDVDQVFARFRGIGKFIHGWAIDRDYCYWQNAVDPIQYDAAGRSYDGLPVKSNGWPPPREKLIIDVSQNAGREVLRTGFIETVGGILWLADGFFERSGCDPNSLDQFSDFDVTSVDGVVRLQIDEDLLANADGNADFIKRLESIRHVLYPNAATTLFPTDGEHGEGGKASPATS